MRRGDVLLGHPVRPHRRRHGERRHLSRRHGDCRRPRARQGAAGGARALARHRHRRQSAGRGFCRRRRRFRGLAGRVRRRRPRLRRCLRQRADPSARRGRRAAQAIQPARDPVELSGRARQSARQVLLFRGVPRRHRRLRTVPVHLRAVDAGGRAARGHRRPRHCGLLHRRADLFDDGRLVHAPSQAAANDGHGRRHGGLRIPDRLLRPLVDHPVRGADSGRRRLLSAACLHPGRSDGASPFRPRHGHFPPFAVLLRGQCDGPRRLRPDLHAPGLQRGRFARRRANPLRRHHVHAHTRAPLKKHCARASHEPALTTSGRG